MEAEYVRNAYSFRPFLLQSKEIGEGGCKKKGMRGTKNGNGGNTVGGSTEGVM